MSEQNVSTVKRTARISPDRPVVGAIAITFVMIVTVVSMGFSFEMLRASAEWAGAPDWARMLTPIYIDGSIISYTIALAVFRWRQEHRYARSALRWLRAYTFASMVLNAMHAASTHAWDFSLIETWGGMLISAAAPLSALVSAEQLIRLTFQQDSHESGAADRAEQAPEPALEPAAEQIPTSGSDDTEGAEEALEMPVEAEAPDSGAAEEVLPTSEADDPTPLKTPVEDTLPVLPVDSDGLFALPRRA